MSAYAQILGIVYVTGFGLSDKKTLIFARDVDECRKILKSHIYDLCGYLLYFIAAVSDRKFAVLKCDVVIDTVDKISGYVDLECLAKCAPLVSQADDNALPVSRGNYRQREHMLGDYVLLDLIELIILLSVLKSSARMRKTVQSVRRIRIMPVIKEIVVQERASYKARLVDLKTGETSLYRISKEKAELGYGNAVLKNGSCTVLGKLLQ